MNIQDRMASIDSISRVAEMVSRMGPILQKLAVLEKNMPGGPGCFAMSGGLPLTPSEVETHRRLFESSRPSIEFIESKRELLPSLSEIESRRRLLGVLRPPAGLDPLLAVGFDPDARNELDDQLAALQDYAREREVRMTCPFALRPHPCQRTRFKATSGAGITPWRRRKAGRTDKIGPVVEALQRLFPPDGLTYPPTLEPKIILQAVEAEIAPMRISLSTLQRAQRGLRAEYDE